MIKCKYYDDGYCTSDNLEYGFCQLCSYGSEDDDMRECSEYVMYDGGQKTIKIWVDDVRNAPKDYDVHLTATITVIKNIEDEFSKNPNQEIILSLDHDAGDCGKYGGDYIKVLDYLDEKYNSHPYSKFAKFVKNKMTFHLHTANPVGRDNMRRIIQKNGWKEV